MSNAARALIGVAAIVVAVVLFVVLQVDDSEDGPEPAATTTETTAGPANGDPATDPQGDRHESQKPEEPEQPEIPTIEIRGGEPVGGVAELEFEQGDTIEFYVESDVADHVHLHGYDVMQDVAPGQRIKFSVPAEITGRFEAELEDRVVPIAEITVNPG